MWISFIGMSPYLTDLEILTGTMDPDLEISENSV
jgi:hypothetical protein